MTTKDVIEERVVKFRAWNHDSKRMSDTFTLLDDIDWYKDESPCYDLMQYTGLKDKNGKEIYDGDILRLDSWAGLQIVKFIEGAFCLQSVLDEHGYTNDIHYIHHAGIPQATVIGNIYESPELLTITKEGGDHE